MSVLRVTVEDEENGRRLDRVLTAHAGGLSRARLQALLAEGRVRNGGRTVGDAAHRVKPGEIYEIDVPPPRRAEPEAQAIPLNVVYEDGDLIVVDKPAGLVVHPAPGNWDRTLVNALLAHCGASLQGIGGVERPGIVHRLDKDTSGLLVAAKTERAMRSLAKQFAAHAIERAYVALVWGAPRRASGVVDAPLGRSAENRVKVAVRADGRPARTRYVVKETFGPRSKPLAARVECRLETGRTHQVRVHMAHLGCPLMGDPVYAKGRTWPKHLPPLARQALHAAVLGFQHPTTHKTLRFESRIPEDIQRLTNALAALAPQ